MAPADLLDGERRDGLDDMLLDDNLLDGLDDNLLDVAATVFTRMLTA